MKEKGKEVEKSLFKDGLMPVFPIEYHFIFICDKNRTLNFKKAIQTKVNYGDVVGDFGDLICGICNEVENMIAVISKGNAEAAGADFSPCQA